MSAVGVFQNEPREFIDVDLTLRTQQVHYLEYVSERDDVPLSRALASIIARKMESQRLDGPRPAKKERKHFNILVVHLAFVDRLCITLGLPRSEVVRRLIDEALTRDQTI